MKSKRPGISGGIQRINLQEESEAAMIHDEMQDYSSMNGAWYFSYYFAAFPCGITYSKKRFVRSDVVKFQKGVSSDVIFNNNETALLFSGPFIVAGHFIVPRW